MHLRGRKPSIAVLGLGLVAMPTNALAYIDPAAGSILLQVLLGGVAGILVITKLYYRKLMTLLGRQPRDASDHPDGDRPSQ